MMLDGISSKHCGAYFYAELLTNKNLTTKVHLLLRRSMTIGVCVRTLDIMLS
jgi:hypothetical protein